MSSSLRWIWWSPIYSHHLSFFYKQSSKKSGIGPYHFSIAWKLLSKQRRSASGYSITNIDRTSTLSFSWRIQANDFFTRETAIVREENESPNDRNDRGSPTRLHSESILMMLYQRHSQSRFLVQQTPCINEQLLSNSNNRAPDRRRGQPAKSRKRTDNCHIRYPLPYHPRSDSGVDLYLEQYASTLRLWKILVNF